MTDQRDEAFVDPSGGTSEVPASVAPASISRRALVKGASVALPTILTLNSNAAFGWAVTSGTIGTRPASTNVELADDAICVIGDTPEGGKAGVYDVTQSEFYQIPGDFKYATGPGGSGTALNAEQACESTLEKIYYKGSGGWTEARPLGGAVASLATPGAMASFSNNVYPDIWPL